MIDRISHRYLSNFVSLLGMKDPLQSYIEKLKIMKESANRRNELYSDITKLDEKKYLEYEKYHGINLTDIGKQVADTIRRKHSTLLEFFEILNIGKEIANQDTEGLEHHLNDKTIRRLRKFITFLKSNPKIIKQFREF